MQNPKSNKNTNKVLIVIFLSLATYYMCNKLFFSDLNTDLSKLFYSKTIGYFLAHAIVASPAFLGVIIIHKPKKFFTSLGLNKSLVKGILFSLFCTLSMLIGYAIFYHFNFELTWIKVFKGAIMAAFIEELLFRGILFGQIYRYTRIGFIPSILLGALLFASLHLYQSQELLTLIGIFFATFLGAILFAWAYVEWNFNLWIPIGLHFFMNFFWMLFSAGENAMGGLYANIFRLITIALIIILTIVYKKRNDEKLNVNKRTLWMKGKSLQNN